MEKAFQQSVTVRWADMDPNGHVRHSVYYDWGASVRMAFLSAHGLTLERMAAEGFGFILFREEALFRREVRYGDALWMNLQLTKTSPDGARFSFRHELTRADGTLCAIINVDGAWIDIHRRKLTTPPPAVREMFEKSPKSADFALM